MAKTFTAKQDANLPVLPPEAEAAVLEEAGERFVRVQALSTELGLKPEVLGRLVQRLRARFQPVLGEVQEIKVAEVLRTLDDRIVRALGYLDDYALAGATAKDLAIVLGILIEKRQLLRGEPTAILSVEERQSMSQLVPLLLAEASRRGMPVDQFGTETVIGPPPLERMLHSRSAQRNPVTAARGRLVADAVAIGEPGRQALLPPAEPLP